MSIRFQVHRTIHAPKEIVYESLINLDDAREWMHGFEGMERLDEGQVQEGSQWLETRKMFGQMATEHFEVVQLVRPEKIVLSCDGTKGTTGKGEFIYTYNLSSTNDKDTDVTLSGEINELTGMAKFFGKMIAGTFRKACAKDLDALKQYIESGRDG
ncbi:SRPBCC family protein [Oceanobacillus polygoni]|uniref:Carbon monoxide dehydrogenase subunit G n=1 Tax=Oceanobacillus polygoni TaxID=1235259 RepID=A0A9X0YRF5_9BACI|nr:SRPBCC family protein [Oceanobacillus polygoni]MBP2077314.1 carbon monoxide dehydrogenase subunit G [Oceanobacillus polygoni]